MFNLHRMKKVLKKALLISGAIFLFLALLILIASFIIFYKKSVIKGMLERYVADKTGVAIEIGHLDYELFPLRIEARAVKVRTKIKETDVDVNLNILGARGELKRLWKKKGPLFDSVEVDGAQVDVRIKMAGEKIDVQKFLLNISQSSKFVRKIELKNSALHLSLSSRNIHLQNLDFSLHSNQKNGEITYSLACKKLLGEMDSRKILLDTSIRSSGVISLAELTSMEGNFFLDSFKVSLKEKNLFLDEILFKFRGEFPKEGDFLLLPRVELDVPGLTTLSSAVKLDFKEKISLLLNPQVKTNDVGAVFALLHPYLPAQLKSLKVRGGALFKGEVQIFEGLSGREMTVDGRLSMDALHFGFSNPSLSIRGLAQGKFGIRGSGSTVDVSGRLKLSKGFFSTKNIKCEEFSLVGPVNFRMIDSSLKISPLQASLKMLTITPREKNIILDEASIRAQAEVTLKRKRIHLSDFSLDIPLLFSFSGWTRADFTLEGTKMISLKSEKIHLQDLFKAFPWLYPEKLRGWVLEGSFGLEVEAWNSPRIPDKEWNITGKLNMDGLNFSNPSFTIAGESLAPRLRFQGSLDSSLKDITFELGFDLPQGETLWKEYYLNLSKIPLTAEIGGKFQTTLQKFSDLKSETFISSLGKISAQGSLGIKPPSSINLSLSASGLNLQSLLSLLPKSQSSSSSSLKLNGKLNSQIRLKREKNLLSVTGSIQLAEGMLEQEEKKLALDGMEANIPFHYTSMMEISSDEEKHQEKGYLLIKSAKLAYFSQSPLRFGLRSCRNKLTVESFSLDVFGGNALFGDTHIQLEPKLSKTSGRTSFALNDTDLSQLPFVSGKFPLQGKGRIDLPRIEVSPDHVETDGQAKIDIFGGNITIDQIRIEKPFSKMRTISCDISFSGINLQKVTDMLPFGRVTGIINGEIPKLSLSYGQPESFTLRIESESRKGIPQKFSLKAANDLAIISSGNQQLQPGKGWTRFISNFRYKKIGIFCSLKNDLFTLRGTIKEKGVEYLVKGDWIFGINVINKKPENQIRFKDMLNRLKRISYARKFP
jgi:hypothetical protein